MRGPLPVEETLTVSEWLALPVAARIAHRLAEVSILLSIVRDEIHAAEDSALSWMDDEIERVFDGTNDSLQRLSF